MGLYIGNQNIANIFSGSNKISNAYIGDQCIYTEDRFNWIFDENNKTAKLQRYIEPEDYTSLKSISIPSKVGHNGELYTVTELSNNAFGNARIMSSIYIPDTIVKVGTEAFIGCTNLSSVYYKGNINEWAGIVFLGDANPLLQAHNLYINNTLVQSIQIDTLKSNSFSGWNGTNVVLSGNITYIPPGAFSYCSNLSSFDIPNTVVRVDRSAFLNSGCVEVYTEGKLLYVDNWVVGNVDMTDTNLPKFKNGTIGLADGAFAASYYDTSSNPIIIPDGVKFIGSNAFSYSYDISYIVLPLSIERIYDYFCFDCTSLSVIGYRGTRQQWRENVSKSTYWSEGIPSTCVVSCSDGDLPIGYAN